MSRLEELIEELCPDGVEYKNIADCADYIQPTEYIVSDTNYVVEGTPVLTPGQSFILGYTIEKDGIYKASKENPIILFDDFTGSLQWVDFPFKVKSSACKIIKAKDNAGIRYLYHVMANLNFRSDEHKRLWISIYSQFEIPIPPLPVQEEIVRILDNFTNLTAELQAKLDEELQARKKQYEYYRDTLLTFGDDVPVVKLSDISRYSKDKITASDVDENSYVGVDNLLQDKKGKTISTHVPTEGNLTKYHKKDVMIGNIRPYLRKIWFADNEGGTNGDVLTIQTISDKILPEFLFVLLSSEDFFNYDINNSKGAKMPRGDKEAVMKYIIPLPPIKRQKEIVSILNRFDTLCNDISTGLPAEIEARQKQYEYYRDKLLSFKETSKVN